MDLNHVKEKIFPYTEKYKELKYDKEGLWSISHPYDANTISEFIKENINKKENISILDATAGLGGNTLSFAHFFDKITAIELDKERFQLLKNNIECYSYNNINIINDSCLNHLYKHHDIYFFDPPWGGPDYKDKHSIELNLGGKCIKEITESILNQHQNSYVILKVPYNFNINSLKKFKFVTKQIKNILVIIIRFN